MKITLRTRPLPDGNESIYLDYYDNGTRYYEYLSLYIVPGRGPKIKRLNDATKQKANEILAQRILAGERPAQAVSSDEGQERLMIDWMEEHIAKLNEDPGFSDSLKFQTKTLVNIVVAALKHMRKSRLPIADLDEKLCVRIVDFIQNKYETKTNYGKTRYSASSVKTYIRRFATMLNQAVREDVIEFNPMHRADIKCEKNEILPPVFLTKDELQAFIDTPAQLTETKRAFVFACFTGLRMSDIYALKWSHIKQTDAGATIVINQKKTKIDVRIPLSPKAMSWLPPRPNCTVDIHVFHLPTADALRTGVQRHAKKAGIEKEICFHTSRHTFATMLVAAGVELATVSQLLGHTSVKTTQIYAEVLDSAKINAVNRFNGLFD